MKSSAYHLVGAYLCLVLAFRDVDHPLNPGLSPGYKIGLFFGDESMHHSQQMLRKVDPFDLLLVGQAMECPHRGEEIKPEIFQNSENCRPW
jgi:hypothetical protein